MCTPIHELARKALINASILTPIKQPHSIYEILHAKAQPGKYLMENVQSKHYQELMERSF